MSLIICICTLWVLPVNATASDPLARSFQDALDVLDRFNKLDAEYMVKKATDVFCTDYNEATVSADEFEAMLNKYFVIDDEILEEIRNIGSDMLVFDEEAQTYTVKPYGGIGGSLPDRQYLGYVKNGETYDVFYQHLTYSYLEKELTDEEYDELFNSTAWGDDVEYEGLVYEAGPEGYTAIASYDNYGRKYTVELNEDVVRILSCIDYTEADLPQSFDDVIVHYDIAEDSGLIIPANDCFENNTTVKVEKVTEGAVFGTVSEAMEEIAEKYTAYEFTATKDDVAVQPNGKLTVTFIIPEEYSTDVTVYYMAEDGTLEVLNSTVDTATRTVTAELEHFSTYVLVDNASKPKPVTPPATTTTAPVTTTTAPITTTEAPTTTTEAPVTTTTAPVTTKVPETNNTVDADVNENTDVPETGDSIGVALWTGIALTAITVLAVVVITKKRVS